MNPNGQIKTATAARDAVIDTVKRWIDSYLGEIAVQTGRERGVLPVFRSYTSSARGFQHWPDGQLPACIVICPGLGDIERKSEQYSVEFPIGVGVLCSGKDQSSTNELVEIYTSAVRALIVQHGSLGGFASETRWIGEDYDELPFDDSRSLAGGTVNIGVRVDAVLSSAAGPGIPPSDPTATPPSVPVVVQAEPVVNGSVGEFDKEIDV